MPDYFTADLHINHRKVAELRGFPTTRAHNHTILDGIRNLPKGSRLFILGDLSVGNTDEELRAAKWVKWAAQHLESIHLIYGNHDSGHPHHSKAHRSELPHFFHSTASEGSLKIAGTRALLHHFPYEGDHTTTDRYPQWRPRNLGAPVIHGHTHAPTPVSYTATGTLQICVSADAWDYTPVSKDTLTHLIEQHHTENKQ